MTSISSGHSVNHPDLDTLFRLYYQELNRFAYRKLGDHEAAADIVQDAFVRYLAAGLDTRGAPVPTHPRFFLWRIVGNLLIDLVRRDRRRGFHAPLEDMAEHLVDPTPGPDRMLEGRQDFRIVKRTLDELPPNCRVALLLNRVDGLTHAQIAEKLGVSPSMVSKYIMTALRCCLVNLSTSSA